tara:strand:- start:1840 stop:2472 length:633 start_codon:yes stop_codon:yes gene_type:complete
MSLKQDGVIIILSSPSGAGKTTLVKKISSLKDFSISVSYTTRVPRPSEVNGKDYYFISNSEFENLIKNEDLLEHAKVFNNFYGSSKNKVFNLLKNGKNVIFDIDWQGAKQIKEKKLNYKLISFFILPPSKKTLLNRLSERENNDKEIIEERMNSFNNDILHWVDYDYVVINDNLEICLNQILEIIDSELKNKKNKFNRDLIKKHINKLID